jgi:hypothetical protein
MIKSDDRCEGSEVLNLLFEVVWFQTSADEHLCGSFGVTNVGKFTLSCLRENEINHSWLIMCAHLLEVEVPIFFRFVVKGSVSHGIVGSSVVAHPDIEASSRELESWSKFRRVDDPLDRAIFDAVLKQDNRSVLWLWTVTTWANSVHLQNVAIFGGHLMFFEIKAIFCHDLFYVVVPIVDVCWGGGCHWLSGVLCLMQECFSL